MYWKLSAEVWAMLSVSEHLIVLEPSEATEHVPSWVIAWAFVFLMAARIRQEDPSDEP